MDFDWDAANRDHIRKHKISPAEAEQALQIQPLILQYQQRGTEERYLALGQTRAGRFVAVVYTERNGRIRVVTAYPMTKRLEEIYLRER